MVKGNQQELLDDIESAFKTHKGYSSVEEWEWEWEWEYDHGHFETHSYSILKAKDFFIGRKSFRMEEFGDYHKN